MKILHTSQDQAVLTHLLFKLERCGRYEEALMEMKGIWDDTNSFPRVEDFEPFCAAEVILRAGALIGFLGHHKNLPRAQENSKNLLTEARQRFIDIYNVEKIAECENYLALAYCRTGEFTEADAWADEALSHQLKDYNQVRLHSVIAKSFVLLSTGKHEENIELCKKYEPRFKRYADPFLMGSFCTNYGISLRNTDNISEALIRYELAREFHQQSGHQIYLGTVENNLAYIYKQERLFKKAHQAIDNSTEIFRLIRERTREGFSLDTKAQIYLAERKYIESLKAVEQAIAILETGENKAYLVETLKTKIVCLIKMDDIYSASLCYYEAVGLAKTFISEQSGDEITKSFEQALRQNICQPVIRVLNEKQEFSAEKLELILPKELSGLDGFQAVWIHNRHLEKYGLEKGSLALIATGEKVERGNLAAITLKGDDSVICGFFDREFGIISIMTPDSEEPQLYDDSQVKVLGRIVGVGHPDDSSSEKVFIKAIPFNY